MCCCLGESPPTATGISVCRLARFPFPLARHVGLLGNVMQSNMRAQEDRRRSQELEKLQRIQLTRWMPLRQEYASSSDQKHIRDSSDGFQLVITCSTKAQWSERISKKLPFSWMCAPGRPRQVCSSLSTASISPVHALHVDIICGDLWE